MTTSCSDRIALSFELFPAKDEMSDAGLRRCVRALAPLKPRFFSVTYGANGSSQGRTVNTIQTLRSDRIDVPVAGHLTCAGASQNDVIEVARACETAGARWTVALRGDGDNGAGGAFVSHESGFASTADLVMALRRETRMRIAVAGYPEPHPDSQGQAADIEHLKCKVDAGADAILTQFFFDNEVFLRYVDAVRKAGIDVPVVPGIMPIRDFDKMASFAKRCGASIPDRLADRFAKAKERGATKELALAVCAGQCDELRDEGVRAFHFYTLNDATLTLGTCQALGLDPSNPVDGGGIDQSESDILESISA